MKNRQYVAAIAVGTLALATTVAPIAAQERVVVPRALLERYAGEYVFPNGNSVAVRLSGDTLFEDAGAKQVVLTPISETQFKLGPLWVVEFVIDEAGGVTRFTSDGVGVEVRATRKASGPARQPAHAASRAPAAAAVRVPRSVLERYAGTYEFIPGQMSRTDLRVVIKLKGDTLTRWMGGADLVLMPISETRFKVGDTRLMVEFVVDEAGVTQIMGSGHQQLLSRLTWRP
jgi:hypothetical protein